MKTGRKKRKKMKKKKKKKIEMNLRKGMKKKR